ncbi:hypothetical protein R1sor_019426 [Riccia sorocarpa]|uniref:Uncharacterized protein n=1 Tax=Riccia sorocarpa TaxID=122646 RepID=A0ABD3IIP9_9MARC
MQRQTTSGTNVSSAACRLPKLSWTPGGLRILPLELFMFHTFSSLWDRGLSHSCCALACCELLTTAKTPSRFIIQWSINQEYKQCWMPKGKPKYPVKRRKSLGREEPYSPKDLQKEILDSITKTVAEMDVKSAVAEESELGLRDGRMGFAVKVELLAQAKRTPKEEPKVTAFSLIKNGTEMLQPEVDTSMEEDDVSD